jgi:hypothetical protein
VCASRVGRRVVRSARRADTADILVSGGVSSDKADSPESCSRLVLLSCPHTCCCATPRNALPTFKPARRDMRTHAAARRCAQNHADARAGIAAISHALPVYTCGRAQEHEQPFTSTNFVPARGHGATCCCMRVPQSTCRAVVAVVLNPAHEPSLCACSLNRGLYLPSWSCARALSRERGSAHGRESRPPGRPGPPCRSTWLRRRGCACAPRYGPSTPLPSDR